MSGGRALEIALRVRPLFEKLAHVTGEVLDQWQIAQWFDGQAVVAHHLVDVGAAGPARDAVNHHRAGTAHANPTGKAVTEAGIEMTLDPGDNIENRLARLLRYLKLFKVATRRCTSPYADSYRSRVYISGN